jgi:pimeloyl-ACP methyl ester carboxylesterase
MSETSALAPQVEGSSIAPGEAYLRDTPVLRGHRGTQPDLYLCWNTIPLSAAAIDVVVFLHGFSQESGNMVVSEKVGLSGLDLSRRTRPTLALLPRGNWIRHYYYDFPALLGGGLDRLVGYGLEVFAVARSTAAKNVAETLAPDRLILAAHSGGGMPAVDALAGAERGPDELFIFDGLYGRDPSLGDPLEGIVTIDRWLADRFATEPKRPGALRVVYFERQTGEFTRAVSERIKRHLAAADPALVPELARRYKIEISGELHRRIAQRCLPELLARSNAEFDWRT